MRVVFVSDHRIFLCDIQKFATTCIRHLQLSTSNHDAYSRNEQVGIVSSLTSRWCLPFPVVVGTCFGCRLCTVSFRCSKKMWTTTSCRVKPPLSRFAVCSDRTRSSALRPLIDCGALVKTCGITCVVKLSLLCLSHACAWNESDTMTATWRTDCNKRQGQEP